MDSLRGELIKMIKKLDLFEEKSPYKREKQHSFHLVSSSPYPLLASFCALCMAVGATMYIHFVKLGLLVLFMGLLSLLFILSLWWRDVIREGTYEGSHTKVVQKGLRIGFVLFIVSEVMFFFAFFWSFFHSSLSPAIEIGSVWPPAGLIPFSPWDIPLLNTYILLLSGIWITAAHYFLIVGKGELTSKSMLLTIVLAVLFTVFQGYEYIQATFNISDSVYGSIFFMATGFHGFHVIIGTLFITVCYFRLHRFHFTPEHHVGFEAAAWYWHFVDVVWLFLFVSIYWWGNL